MQHLRPALLDNFPKNKILYKIKIYKKFKLVNIYQGQQGGPTRKLDHISSIEIFYSRLTFCFEMVLLDVCIVIGYCYWMYSNVTSELHPDIVGRK